MGLMKKDLETSKSLAEEQSLSIIGLEKENKELLAELENTKKNGDTLRDSLQKELDQAKIEIEDVKKAAAQQVVIEREIPSKESITLQNNPLPPPAEVDELLEEIESLKRQVGNNSSDEVEQLREEIKTLKRQLVLASKRNKTPQDDPSVMSSEEVEELLEEIESLKSQIRESKTVRNDPLTPPSEVDELLEEIEFLKSQVGTTSPEEVERLQKEVKNLKRQLILANKKARTEAKRADEAMLANQGRNKDGGAYIDGNVDAIDEILTLQDEVSRLNDELSEARNSVKEHDPNDSSELIRRYDELKRLSDAVIEKDREIEDLKDEVNLLNEELDAHADDNSGTSGIPIGSTITTGTVDPSILKVKDDAIKSRDDEIGALREINEMLRKEVEITRRDCDDAKHKLKEEAQRSAMELEAFSQTLRGVDELRKAAEAMSRELNRTREVVGANDDSSIGLRSHGSYAATSQLDEASRILDASHSRSEPQVENYPLWDRVKNSLAIANRELLQRTPSSNTSISSRPSMNGRQRRRRRRRKGGDDESIISAFF